MSDTTAPDARAVLADIRQKLRAGTATSADFRPALEAMLQLPESEGGRWLEEFLRRFAFVYATESHREACEDACDEPRTESGGGAVRGPDPVHADGPTVVAGNLS